MHQKRTFKEFCYLVRFDILAAVVIFCVIAVDQFSKNLILSHFDALTFMPRTILGPYLEIIADRNNGAAFSLFTNSIFLIVVILCMIVVLCVFYFRVMRLGQHYYKLSLALILGGALSNLIDRVLHGGYVTDFISFNIPQISFHFAVFNLADACITIGICILFFQLLFPRKVTTSITTVQESANVSQ